jgi:hypothetical protein
MKPFRLPKHFMQTSEFEVRAALARFIENLARFAKSFYFLATYHALSPKHLTSVKRAP